MNASEAKERCVDCGSTAVYMTPEGWTCQNQWHYDAEEKEPAPKEGETAKVESRDALPPLGEFGFEQFNGRSDVWKAIVEIREDQLRASLLREKGKDEEIEPLKGLMERACNVLSSGIVGMPEEVRREARMVVREYIKTAVTGEQR